MVPSSVLAKVVVPELEPDDLVPAAIAAAHFECSTAVIKGWANRGRIKPVRRDPRWGRLYRWGDLVAAEKATRLNPNPNRRQIPSAA